MINGVTQLIMTKADVLSAFGNIKICTKYQHRGEEIDYLPFDVLSDDMTPIYEELPGWTEDLTELSSIEGIPASLNNYIEFLEKHLETPITIVSVGPDRKQTLMRKSELV